MLFRAGIDELQVYPDAVARTLHATLHDKTHAQLSADLTHTFRGIAIRLDAGAGDDAQSAYRGELRQHLVMEPIREVAILLVAAAICEGKHSDGRSRVLEVRTEGFCGRGRARRGCL